MVAPKNRTDHLGGWIVSPDRASGPPQPSLFNYWMEHQSFGD
jgi:hypothetical protein